MSVSVIASATISPLIPTCPLFSVRLTISDVTPSPWSALFGRRPAAPQRRRSRGFCSSPVHEYYWPLRLLARHSRRLRLFGLYASLPSPSGGTVRDLPGSCMLLSRRAARTHHVVFQGLQVFPSPPLRRLGIPWIWPTGSPFCRLRPGDSPQALQTPPHGGRPALRGPPGSSCPTGTRFVRSGSTRRPSHYGQPAAHCWARRRRLRACESRVDLFFTPPPFWTRTSHARRGITPAFGYGPRLKSVRLVSHQLGTCTARCAQRGLSQIRF